MTAPMLAIDGGAPLRSAPMPRWPDPTEAEIAAVEAVLRSGRINYHTGDRGRAFEAAYAAYCGRSHGIALANGTLALELALRAYGIGAGDEVIVPARTFVATASAVAVVGATPVVADIEPDSGNMSAETAAACVTERTRAIIPVHLGGWPVEMAPLMDLAAKHGLVVIEDCAQAHGATLDGVPVGGIGHAGAFSFCQDKIITTGGEGGMLVLDDDVVYRRAWEYKDHGKSLEKVLDPCKAPGANFKWLHDSFGTNWRLTEMQSAIGLTALAELPAWHAARTRNATRLAAALAKLPGIRVPLPREGATHAFYRLYTHVEPEALAPGWDRDRVMAAVSAEGVGCFYGSAAEIYREEAFALAGLRPAAPLPGAARAHETSLAFLVHPTLTDTDIDDMAAAVAKVMEVAAP